ncbi:MAG: DNA-directed RNA polymerase subunit B'' [Candidatus Parvarchaeota archaeon]|nr:DNA-directed RNA polymerase subunit B'' [Candidatus Parvarchaeota archaeon]MCW1301675.1 DNA-directed RNA polymerase subunit B'' [Candidatus Parvarchaeota archaeon]
MEKERYLQLLDSALSTHEAMQYHIESFNFFVENTLQKIISSNSIIEPAIKPTNSKEFYIKLGKAELLKPEITEVDSAVRKLMPMEARIRDLTYNSPIFLPISYISDGNTLMEENIFIGRLPVVVKSKLCHLYGLSHDELIKAKEDPYDPGGYFIINGTERIILTTEDLVPNNVIITKEGREGILYSAKIFADAEEVKVPHVIFLSNNNLLYISFGKLKKIPIVTLLKALGLENENSIKNDIAGEDEDFKNIMDINFEVFNPGTEKEALESIGNSIHSMRPKETAEMNIDSLLLPFIGRKKDSRNVKAEYIKFVVKYLLSYEREGKEVYKDHYSNKRLHSENYNLDMLFRFVFKQVINDAKYNFERGVKKDKIQPPQYIFTSDQLTSRLTSALATGQWVGGRVGITQHLDRKSFPFTISNLRKVESLLSSNRENYEARDLHGTHFGRFCPIETPEGPKIGLTKHLASLAKISEENNYKEEIVKRLKDYGVKAI